MEMASKSLTYTYLNTLNPQTSNIAEAHAQRTQVEVDKYAAKLKANAHKHPAVAYRDLYAKIQVSAARPPAPRKQRQTAHHLLRNTVKHAKKPQYTPLKKTSNKYSLPIGLFSSLYSSPLLDKFGVSDGEYLSPIDYEGEDDYRNYFKRTDFPPGSLVNPTYDKTVMPEIIKHSQAVCSTKHTWVALTIPQSSNSTFDDYLFHNRVPEIHLNNPLQHQWGWDDEPRPQAGFRTRIICIGLYAPHNTQRVYKVKNNSSQGFFEISHSWVQTLTGPTPLSSTTKCSTQLINDTIDAIDNCHSHLTAKIHTHMKEAYKHTIPDDSALDGLLAINQILKDTSPVHPTGHQGTPTHPLLTDAKWTPVHTHETHTREFAEQLCSNTPKTTFHIHTKCPTCNEKGHDHKVCPSRPYLWEHTHLTYAHRQGSQDGHST